MMQEDCLQNPKILPLIATTCKESIAKIQDKEQKRIASTVIHTQEALIYTILNRTDEATLCLKKALQLIKPLKEEVRAFILMKISDWVLQEQALKGDITMLEMFLDSEESVGAYVRTILHCLEKISHRSLLERLSSLAPTNVPSHEQVLNFLSRFDSFQINLNLLKILMRYTKNSEEKELLRRLIERHFEYIRYMPTLNQKMEEITRFCHILLEGNMMQEGCSKIIAIGVNDSDIKFAILALLHRDNPFLSDLARNKIQDEALKGRI